MNGNRQLHTPLPHRDRMKPLRLFQITRLFFGNRNHSRRKPGRNERKLRRARSVPCHTYPLCVKGSSVHLLGLPLPQTLGVIFFQKMLHGAVYPAGFEPVRENIRENATSIFDDLNIFNANLFKKAQKIRLPNQEADFRLEQVKGIEPSWPAWEAGVLPLNYTCVFLTADVL